MNSEKNDITAMLAAWAEGDKNALDRLTSRLYPEFRRIARQYLVRRTGDSLESAALANEIYLKLTSAGRIRLRGPNAFPRALCTDDPTYSGGPCTEKDEHQAWRRCAARSTRRGSPRSRDRRRRSG